MELRVAKMCDLFCRELAGPLALWAHRLYPCTLIIFTLIYWLFLSAEADSLSKNSDVNNSAVLGSHKAALVCNYQAVLSWFCILIRVPKNYSLFLH